MNSQMQTGSTQQRARIATAFALKIFLLAGCASSSAMEPPAALAKVPVLRTEPIIDGQITPDEWKGALHLDAGDGTGLLVGSAGNKLFLAVRRRPGSADYVDLFVTDGSEIVRNYHASFRLGYRLLAGDSWTDREPPTNWAEQLGWTANVVRMNGAAPSSAGLLGSVLPYDGFEFAIDRDTFASPDISMRIEVRNFEGELTDTVLPVGAERFGLESWLKLELNNAK
ncbi:MAG: hypothetical protein R3E02_06240 [Blastomonas sp.]